MPAKWRNVFGSFVALLIVGGFAGAFGTFVVEMVNHGETDESRGASAGAYDQLYYLAEVWLWCNCCTDIIISSMLIARLYINRKRVTIKGSVVSEGTQELLNSFMRLAFEAAASTVIVSAAAAILL